MNAEVLTIDDLCAGLEEATKADEIAKTDEKLEAFVSKVQTAFENAYIYYKTTINLNARSPHTKTFKDWLRHNKNLRSDLPQPYIEWCRTGFSMYFDEEIKEILWVVNIRDAYMSVPRLEIRSRNWNFKDLDRPQTGVTS